MSLEEKAFEDDVSFEQIKEKIELSINFTCKNRVYENILQNLKKCNTKNILTFSRFPNVLQKCLKDCEKNTIIVLDLAYADGEKLKEYDEFLKLNMNFTCFLGTSDVEKFFSNLPEEKLEFIFKHKKPFFARLCEDLYSVGKFAKENDNKSQLLLLFEAGCFDFGGAVSGLSLLEKDEISLLAQEKIFAIYCPTAGLKRGYAIPSLYTFVSRKTMLCLGTDNAYSDTFDVESEFELAKNLSKSIMSDATLFGGDELKEIFEDNAKKIFEKV